MINRMYAQLIAPFALCVLGLSTSLAGPLNPPAGPVAPTHKTLTEIDPRIVINSTNTPGDNDATPSTFKITTSGSYVLTSNVLLGPAKIGIEIAANNVVIDLGGFHLTNFSTLPAISVSGSNLTNITLCNGSVSGAAGIDLSASTQPIRAEGGRVENVHASSAGGTGIITQRNAVVRGCTANTCTIGISVGDGTVVEDCVVWNNTLYGMSVGDGSTVTQCTARENTSHGFITGFNVTFENCSAYTNQGNGFFAGAQCVLRGCSASFNQRDGMSTDVGSLISDCAANANTRDGIRVTYGCTVLNNVSRQNGNATGDGAGIHATNNDNRIEGNNCSSNDRGIEVGASGNIILRNTCATNTTNWFIAANNVVGPILDRTAPGSAAINGNSAPDSTGSSHPNANFSY